MSTSPSDGAKPGAFSALLKGIITTEHARSHHATSAGVDLPACAQCGAPRESEASHCVYCREKL
jgi:hypothetical protein